MEPKKESKIYQSSTFVYMKCFCFEVSVLTSAFCLYSHGKRFVVGLFLFHFGGFSHEPVAIHHNWIKEVHMFLFFLFFFIIVVINEGLREREQLVFWRLQADLIFILFLHS